MAARSWATRARTTSTGRGDAPAHVPAPPSTDRLPSTPSPRRTDAPPSSLAALLDRLTHQVNEPRGETIGDFSETIQALHAELAMLATQFMIPHDGAEPPTSAPVTPGVSSPEPHDTGTTPRRRRSDPKRGTSP
jgi:hypothetical protein